MVSICIPIYRVELFIGKCAESLFKQTYKDIEYVFVDDCSPDKSVDILKKIVESFPERKSSVKIIKHTTNRGLAAARNTGILACKGEFITFVDSDDWIDYNFISLLVEKQREGNYDVVSSAYLKHNKCSTEVVIPSDYAISKDVCLSLLKRTLSPNIWGRLIRRSLLIDNGLFCKEGVNMGEDLQQTTRIFYFARSIAFQPNTRYHYNRLNESSYTHGKSFKMDIQMWASFDLLKEFFKNKGNEFLNAWRQGEAKMIGWSLKHLNRVDNVDEYYKYLMIRWHELPWSYIKYMDINARIAVLLHNKRLICYLISLYDINMAIKKTINSLKKRFGLGDNRLK
jgi:glycosyltransferase involved in cell wall biosynthesis